MFIQYFLYLFNIFDIFNTYFSHQLKKNLKYMEKYDMDEEAEIIYQLKEYRNERLASEKPGEERRDVSITFVQLSPRTSVLDSKKKTN